MGVLRRRQEIAAGALRVGGGTKITKILHGTFSFNPGGADNSVAANATEANTVTIDGVSVGDIVMLHPRGLEAGLVVEDYSVTAANTVTIAVRNVTAAAVTTAASTWEYLVIKA